MGIPLKAVRGPAAKPISVLERFDQASERSDAGCSIEHKATGEPPTICETGSSLAGLNCGQ
jgi:hypothetical protein